MKNKIKYGLFLSKLELFIGNFEIYCKGNRWKTEVSYGICEITILEKTYIQVDNI